MMIYSLIFIAILIGALMPIQAGINAELGRVVAQPYMGALISFLIGTIGLTIIVLGQGAPTEAVRKIPFHSPLLLTGGLLGALFVASSIFLIPKIGATNMIAAFVTGQLLMSVVMDHYGMLGLRVHEISIQRLVGIILLFGGLYLVIRKSA